MTRMDVREKLVEILKQAPFEGKVLDEWWWEEKIKRIADHLISNGVTVECFIYRTINTNADKIRAMSDEELAKVMERMLGCPITGDCKKMSEDCNDCWLDWLRQPAEEDDHA